MKALDYIVTARHYSLAEGADGSVKDRILKMRERIKLQRGITLQINGLDSTRGEAAVARIWQGQWIADCPDCNGAQFVDPEEPIYFCFVCGNRNNDCTPRPVKFPPEARRLEIESLLLERPVNDVAGLTDLERAGLAKPIVAAEVEQPDGSKQVILLARDWNGENVAELKKQNAAVSAWQKDGKYERG